MIFGELAVPRGPGFSISSSEARVGQPRARPTAAAHLLAPAFPSREPLSSGSSSHGFSYCAPFQPKKWLRRAAWCRVGREIGDSATCRLCTEAVGNVPFLFGLFLSSSFTLLAMAGIKSQHSLAQVLLAVAQCAGHQRQMAAAPGTGARLGKCGQDSDPGRAWWARDGCGCQRGEKTEWE